jgi:uncharacterized repeat protein (TIGR03803 family)
MSKLSLWKTICLLCVLYTVGAISSPAQTFTTLLSFNGTDGANPYYGSLVQGLDGNFYGTTNQGGANCAPYGCGTVFKITPGGTLTTLYSFCAQTNCPDGYYPYAGLVQATNGNFYGITFDGGTNNGGTVFKITPARKLTTLYRFCSPTDCTDGDGPAAALVQATNGNFYGTTYFGGANTSCNDGTGCGTVFKITPAGTLTVLHSFDATDGANPEAGLVQATNANFYGTTFDGGANGPGGTAFKITPAGTLTTLYNFCAETGCPDGERSLGVLVQAANGQFYGTTELGGANNGGTVFKITARGTLTTLYSFCSQTGCTDGKVPGAGLVQATNGKLYGTTEYGGANGGGTVFEITAAGKLTTLYNFCSQTNCTDGADPSAGLAQATNGNFYGTTTSGGASSNCSGGCGTVFSLSEGLGPFVETLPTSGTVGAAVIILGNNLTGSTSVTFNGTAATFTVVSSTEIRTTVPTGATTGKVKVTTPKGTLTSNVNFRVP